MQEAEWAALLEPLRRFKGMSYNLRALLNGDCRQRYVDGDTLVLVFKNAANRERFEKELEHQPSKQAFSEAVAVALGGELSLRVETGGGRRPAGQHARAPGAQRGVPWRQSHPGAGGAGMNRNMMRQAQQLQQRLAKMQEELESATVEATAGGGMVKAVVTGKQTVASITIDPEAVDPDDLEVLEEMVMAAVNEALGKSQELAQQKMASITGGLNIPGLR